MPAPPVARRVKAAKAKRDVNRAARAAAPIYDVEPLNPWLNCGPDTTVKDMWKVRERRGAETIFHLVYHDRYGWYCEHGPKCAAVPEVRRAARELAEFANSVKRVQGKSQRRRRK